MTTEQREQVLSDLKEAFPEEKDVGYDPHNHDFNIVLVRGLDFVRQMLIKEKSGTIQLFGSCYQECRRIVASKRNELRTCDVTIPEGKDPKGGCACWFKACTLNTETSQSVSKSWYESRALVIRAAREVYEKLHEWNLLGEIANFCQVVGANLKASNPSKDRKKMPMPAQAVSKEVASTRKGSSQESKKRAEDTMLDWSNVSFCDPNIIKHEDIVNVLVGGKESKKIFPKSLREIFLQRYGKMKENFLKPLSEDIWRQGGGKWGSDLSLADPTRYKDALLRIDKECFSQKDDFWVGEDGLLEYPCVGHDLPVWLSLSQSPQASLKGKRIMFVSQDPLRSEHGIGALYLSTPWGLHSANYRDNGQLNKLIHGLVQAGVTVYLTDYQKIYNKHKDDQGGPGKCCDCVIKKTGEIKKRRSCPKANDGGCGSFKWDEIKDKKNSVRKELKDSYQNAIADECSLFDPDCIITLGVDASSIVNSRFAKGFTKSVSSIDYRGADEFVIRTGNNTRKIQTLAFLHPTAYIDGEGAMIEYFNWVQQKISETLSTIRSSSANHQ